MTTRAQSLREFVETLHKLKQPKQRKTRASAGPVDVKVAATAILAVLDSAMNDEVVASLGTPDMPELPKRIRKHLRTANEPYRATAYLLGWEQYDGSNWWDAVMDEIG